MPASAAVEEGGCTEVRGSADTLFSPPLQLTDYDRHNNSYSKLRDKKEKSLSDEKNLFKVCRVSINRLSAPDLLALSQYEQDFEAASAEYEHYNTLCKTELPQFLHLSTRFIDPLFHSFYFMQCVVKCPPSRDRR